VHGFVEQLVGGVFRTALQQGATGERALSLALVRWCANGVRLLEPFDSGFAGSYAGLGRGELILPGRGIPCFALPGENPSTIPRGSSRCERRNNIARIPLDLVGRGSYRGSELSRTSFGPSIARLDGVNAGFEAIANFSSRGT
jgi:hypothetical protein